MQAHQRVNWTPALNELVARLWSEGHSALEISREIPNATKNCIVGKISRLVLPPRVRTAAGRKPKPKPAPVKRRAQRSWVPVKKPPTEPMPVLKRTPPMPLPTEGLLLFTDPRRLDQCAAPMWPDDQRWAGNAVLLARVCGHPTDGGSPYCEAHRRLFYHKPDPARRQNYEKEAA